MAANKVPAGGSLEFLSPPRRQLLLAIKEIGQATTEELARETFLSPGAVRQHLLALEAQGLVSFVRVREGPGRPRHVFRLTLHSHALFPQQYASLANAVLEALEVEEPGTHERILARVVEAQVQFAQDIVTAAGREQRLREMVELIERNGYFPRVEVVDNGPALLELRHCPLFEVAREHPSVCEIECRSISGVLGGATVNRLEHRLAGDEICTYEIQAG